MSAARDHRLARVAAWIGYGALTVVASVVVYILVVIGR